MTPPILLNRIWRGTRSELTFFPVCLAHRPRCIILAVSAPATVRLTAIDEIWLWIIMTLAGLGPAGVTHSIFCARAEPRLPGHSTWCSSHPSAHLGSEILCARRPVLTSAFLLNRARNITQAGLWRAAVLRSAAQARHTRQCTEIRLYFHCEKAKRKCEHL